MSRETKPVWYWLVPLGCLGTIGAVVLFLAAVLLPIAFSVPSLQSFERVSNDHAVIAVLGTPIKRNWLTVGNISINGPSGDADFHYDIRGPAGKARVNVVAQRADGKWFFETIRVTPKNGLPIDLVKPVSPPESTSTTPPTG